MDTDDVIATAYDSGVPGFQMTSVATLRLWSAQSGNLIDLEAFNRDNVHLVDIKRREPLVEITETGFTVSNDGQEVVDCVRRLHLAVANVFPLNFVSALECVVDTTNHFWH